jgi:hypothetical protein
VVRSHRGGKGRIVHSPHLQLMRPWADAVLRRVHSGGCILSWDVVARRPCYGGLLLIQCHHHPTRYVHQDSCTPDFMDFVHWLGEPIQLRGWKGYRAGLDVNGKGHSGFVRVIEPPVRPCATHNLNFVQLMTTFTLVGGTTGDKSIFTHWNGYQVMFHCAPFIPFNPNDHQQVERRRFIGNDIVRCCWSCE